MIFYFGLKNSFGLTLLLFSCHREADAPADAVAISLVIRKIASDALGVLAMTEKRIGVFTECMVPIKKPLVSTF